MAVNLRVSKVLNDGGSPGDPGPQVNDVLAGNPANEGLDLGQVINGAFTPITDQPTNQGHQDIYISHDAGIDQITDVKFFIDEFSQVYGGADSAAGDKATLIAKGQADNEVTANNSDGNSSGLRIEQAGREIASLGASAFLPSRGQVDIFGNNGTDGVSLASAFDMHVDSASFNNAGSEVDASSPVTGQIGKITDTVLGDRCHLGMRAYLEQSAPDGGIIQWDFIIGYSFTA